MPNPYLQDQVNALQTSATNNLNRNILPSINGGYRSNLGMGSNRQGIAQGLAIEGTNRGVADAATNLYAQGYNIDQNIANQQAQQRAQLDAQKQLAEMQDATNRLSIGNNYNLGLGGLGLQGQSLDNNFYTTNRGLDISQMGLGANLVGQANTGLSNQGTQLYQSGQAQQQAPWSTLGNYSNTIGQFSGLGGSNVSTTPGPNAFQGALAGGLTLAQIYKLLGG